MKLIDQKGRLFGRFNIFDFIVLVVFAVFISMFAFGLKAFMKKKPDTSMNKEFITIDLFCNIIKLKPEMIGKISVGDRELNKEGQEIARVTWLGQPQTHQYKVDIGLGEPKIVDDAVLKQLPAKITMVVELKDNNQVYYKDMPVAMDRVFDFKTDKYSLKAMPVPLEMINERWLRIWVKFQGISPGLANLINSGQIEKNRKGRIIGKLDKITSRKPSKVSVLRVTDNKIAFVNDPYTNDIIAVLDILCNEKDGVLYYQNFQVKIGGQFNFSSDIYIVPGTIIGIEKN